MNRFRLPYHLVVEDGIFNDIPDCMKDVFPELKRSKTILVTEENLKGLFEEILDEIQKDFPKTCKIIRNTQTLWMKYIWI